jgi:CHAD domain-containing protein
MQTIEYAADRADRLLGQLAFEVSHARQRPDADNVHDLRVGIRRFTQALVVFEPCFPAKEAAKIRRRLKEMMALAGEVRNFDIALKFLSRSDLAESGALRSQLQAGRKEAERALVCALRRWTERKSSAKWRRGLHSETPSKPFSESATEVAAQQVLSRLVEKFSKTGEKAVAEKATPKDLHRLRIHSKRFRYSLELFAPLYGATLTSCLGRIRKVQALLGAINDCQTVRDLLSRFGGGKELDAELKKRQRRKTNEFSRYWADAFAGPEREHMERYLTSGVRRKRTTKALAARGASSAASSSSGSSAAA